VDRIGTHLSREGGVLLAIRNNFEFKCIVIDNIYDIDQVFVLVNYNNVKLLLGCVYIPVLYSSYFEKFY